MSLVPSADDPTKPGLNSRQSARDFLLGRINYERMVSVPYTKRHMKLDRMRELLTRLGNPDAGLPIVHVAGTKGKGSTAAMIARILHAAGYNTGLFASPHLEDISERFVVNGIPCPVAELEVLVEQLRPVVEEMDREVHTKRTVGLTYFELTTAIALMFFAKRKVDIAVLEVGLGGRLDSTNVCQSTLSVITNISLDHTKQLGDTVEAIAAEKAGIIKPGVPVLCGDLEPGPRRVIAEIARQHGSRLFEEGQDFFHTYQPPRNLEREDSRGLLRFTGVLGGESIELSDISLNLFGAHQAANAALAIAVCARLRRQGWSISWESICGAFAGMKLPGRIEVVRRSPVVILDVAHNVASVEALVEAVNASFDCPTRVLVLAGTREKDIHGMARVLLPHFQRVIVTQYQENPRAVPSAELLQVVRSELARLGRTENAIAECALPRDAWELAQLWAEPDDLICVTGSFFIIAELRSVIRTECELSRPREAVSAVLQRVPGSNPDKQA